MVQFDTILYGRSSKNYFGQFLLTENNSHYISRVSLHEAQTKNKYSFSKYTTDFFVFILSFLITKLLMFSVKS